MGSFDENSHPLQVNLQGIYSREPDLHNLKPVYRHIYSQWYIYYNTDWNQDNTSFSYWAVGREVGSDLISVIATVNTPDPSFVSGSWKIYSNTLDSFVAEESFKAECVPNHRDYCRTGELLLTVDGDLELLEDTLPLHDDLQIYLQRTAGVYVLTNDILNSRPVYKMADKDLYLYYTYNRANGYMGWVIGSILGSELGHILFIKDYAMRPELITSESWGYISVLSAAVLPTFLHTNKIKLTCNGEYQYLHYQDNNSFFIMSTVLKINIA